MRRDRWSDTDAAAAVRIADLHSRRPCLLDAQVVVATITMHVTYDPEKRERTFRERGLDFEDAPLVFAGPTLEIEDTREDYGEPRIICYGFLAGRMAVLGYTPRGAARHVFSMRKANAREQARIAPLLEI